MNANGQVDSLLALPTSVFPLFGIAVGVPDGSPTSSWKPDDKDLRPRLPVDAVLMKDGYISGSCTAQKSAQVFRGVLCCQFRSSNSRWPFFNTKSSFFRGNSPFFLHFRSKIREKRKAVSCASGSERFLACASDEQVWKLMREQDIIAGTYYEERADRFALKNDAFCI